MLHQSSYENTIARIRSQVYEHRINLSELFHDFDKLRSGTVQINQFKRCIALIMDRAANPLNEQDYATLAAKHGITVDGAHLARWCEFQKTIDKVFHDETTRLKHHKPKNNTPEFTSVIKTLNEYTKNHGSDVKTFFSDFDKQNSGFITTSQFRRGLPANLLTAEQQDILYSVFYDTDRKTFNYFKLDRQVQRSKHQIEAPQQKKLEKITKSANVDLVPIGTEELLCPKQKHELSVDEILNETRKFVYKNRIRVVDFFRDFDKHNSGLVTKHQFLSGLDNAKFIATENLCEYYKTDKGINYRLFCADIESVFTTVGLCHDPLINISKPSIEYLVDGVNKLSVQDEAQCQEIITHLKGIVAEKRTLLAPYFKDFDRNHLGNMGNVTKSHFSRLLSSLKLEVSDANLKILFKKFENKNDRINYMAFIHAIDASTYEPEKIPQVDSQAVEKVQEQVQTISEIQSKLKTQIESRRINVIELFKDFDKLRSYRIHDCDFARCVSSIGVPLTQPELDLLCTHYGGRFCKWKDFCVDIGHVNGIIEKLGNDDKKTDLIMDAIKSHVAIHRISLKPFFKDFDHLNQGFITKSQFRQCLTFAGCKVDQDEFDLLVLRWTTGGRISYMQFLNYVEPYSVKESKTEKRQFYKEKPEILSENDLEKLIQEIKLNVKTRRIRILDFMKDFDHLKHGKITNNEFKRALSVNISLSDIELNSLQEKYKSNIVGYVDYVAFSNDIESAFTISHLEKTPLKTPVQFKPTVIVPKTSKTLSEILVRIQSHLAEKRLDIYSFLEDYDFVNEGTISTNQFRSILATLGINLDDQEICAISDRFRSKTTRERVNYRAFCGWLGTASSGKGKEWIRENRFVAADALW